MIGSIMRYCCAIMLALQLTTLSAGAQRAASENVIVMAIAPDVLADFNRIMKGRAVDHVASLDPLMRRDVLEVFSSLYLLKLGGVSDDVDFVSSSSLERHLSLLSNAAVAMSAALIDSRDTLDTPNLIILDSLAGVQIQRVGLFTAPGNERALSARALRDLSSLIAVSNKAWKRDWDALSATPVAQVISVPEWTLMSRMVMAERVDFLLAPIRREQPDQLETPVGLLSRMAPFAINVEVERSLILSAHHPDANRLATALTAGMTKLPPNHFLRQAFDAIYEPNDLEKRLLVVNAR